MRNFTDLFHDVASRGTPPDSNTPYSIAAGELSLPRPSTQKKDMPMNSNMLVLAVLCGVLPLTGCSDSTSPESAPTSESESALSSTQKDTERGNAEAECDRLATSPYDPGRKAKGVTFKDIDPASAIESCRQAVRLNPTPRLQFQYGRSLEKAEQYGEALKWYRKAAEQGHVRAQTNLGVMYAEGRGATKNDEEAAKWYSKARAQRIYATQKVAPTREVAPTRAQYGIYGHPNLLAILARGDISSIPQDPYTYLAVEMIMSALGYSKCSLREPQLSLYKSYFLELFRRMEAKRPSVRDDPGVFLLIGALHPQYLKTLAFLAAKGCDSDEVQAVMENAFRFGLGHDPVDGSAAAVIPLITSKQISIHWSHADPYCRYPPDDKVSMKLGGGREDPACEKLIKFMNRGVRYRLPDGSMAPAIGERPQVLRCTYDANTGKQDTGFWKKFTFWYESAPENLSSLGAHGRNPFLSVEPVARTVCPKDTDAVAELVQSSR